MERDEKGFTLIELLVASLLAMILMGTGITLILRAYDMTETAVNYMFFNQQARVMFSLAAMGAVLSDSQNNEPAARVVGFRGARRGTPTGDSIRVWLWDGSSSNGAATHTLGRSYNRLVLSHANDTSLSWASRVSHHILSGDAIGWLYAKKISGVYQVDDRDAVAATTGITFQLMSPAFIAEHPDYYSGSPSDLEFLSSRVDVRQSYRSSFYMPVDY